MLNLSNIDYDPVKNLDIYQKTESLERLKMEIVLFTNVSISGPIIISTD